MLLRHSAPQGAALLCAKTFWSCHLLSYSSLAHGSGRVGTLFTARRIHFCSASAADSRPSLDDVEKLSRGKPSKAKMGSRRVPHRLNAEERKAFELAKRRAFLVVKPSTRRYPVTNTFRNHCLALGWPVVRIEQGLPEAGACDRLVVDLLPLQLGAGPQAGLARAILDMCSPGSPHPADGEPAGRVRGPAGGAMGEDRAGVRSSAPAAGEADGQQGLSAAGAAYGDSSGSDDEGAGWNGSRAGEGPGSVFDSTVSGGTRLEGLLGAREEESEDGPDWRGAVGQARGEVEGEAADDEPREGVLCFECSRQEAKMLARRVLDYCREQHIAPLPHH